MSERTLRKMVHVYEGSDKNRSKAKHAEVQTCYCMLPNKRVCMHINDLSICDKCRNRTKSTVNACIHYIISTQRPLMCRLARIVASCSYTQIMEVDEDSDLSF